MHKATDHFDNLPKGFTDGDRSKPEDDSAKFLGGERPASESPHPNIVAIESAPSVDLDTAKTGARAAEEPGIDSLETSMLYPITQIPRQPKIRPATPPAHAGKLPFDRFAWRFLKDCRGRWKPATFKTHRGQIRRQLVPIFGKLSLDEITKFDVIRWYENPAHQCPRALSILSSIMLHAEQVGLRSHGSNPCLGLRRKQSEFQAYYPTPSEYLLLGRALEQSRASEPVLATAILFLALTGARKGEALNACWRDLNEKRVVLSDSKSGPKVIWLSAPVQALMDELPKTPKQRYLFGRCSRKTLSGRLTKFWHQIRSEQGIPKMRLHDFRHGFASRGVNQGLDIRIIGRLLGHVDFASTLGYAHLDEAPLKEASERVSRRLRGRNVFESKADQTDAERRANPAIIPSRGRRRGR